MRYLVTGGAGFLGSHLCASLLSDGHEVIALDNMYTGKRENIQNFLQNPNFEFIRHDVTFPIYLEVDAIFNLACPASPIHYQKYPVQTIKTSILGAVNMLGLAKRLKIPFLQASTSEVYGDPEISPQSEDYWGHVNPIGLRSCYDEGKRAAESLCFDYQRQYEVDIKVARIFNTYGPKMSFNDGRIVSNLIVQALQGQPLTIYGDGLQTRSFCYVDDLIVGLRKFMDKGGVSGPINLGNNNEITILEAAKVILNSTKSDSKFVFTSLPKDDPRQRRPDTSLAEKLLGWRSSVSFEEGIHETVFDFQKRMSLK